jgi:hypothetical protein
MEVIAVGVRGGRDCPAVRHLHAPASLGPGNRNICIQCLMEFSNPEVNWFRGRMVL